MGGCASPAPSYVLHNLSNIPQYDGNMTIDSEDDNESSSQKELETKNASVQICDKLNTFCDTQVGCAMGNPRLIGDDNQLITQWLKRLTGRKNMWFKHEIFAPSNITTVKINDSISVE